MLFGESTSRGIVSLGLRLGAFGCAAIGLSDRVILLVLCAFVRRLISQGITPRVMGFLRGHEYYCNEEILRPSRLFDECNLAKGETGFFWSFVCFVQCAVLCIEHRLEQSGTVFDHR